MLPADCWLKNNIYTSIYFIFRLCLIFVEFVIFAMFSFLPFLRLCVDFVIIITYTLGGAHTRTHPANAYRSFVDINLQIHQCKMISMKYLKNLHKNMLAYCIYDTKYLLVCICINILICFERDKRLLYTFIRYTKKR